MIEFKIIINVLERDIIEFKGANINSTEYRLIQTATLCVNVRVLLKQNYNNEKINKRYEFHTLTLIITTQKSLLSFDSNQQAIQCLTLIKEQFHEKSKMYFQPFDFTITFQITIYILTIL